MADGAPMSAPVARTPIRPHRRDWMGLLYVAPVMIVLLIVLILAAGFAVY